MPEPMGTTLASVNVAGNATGMDARIAAKEYRFDTLVETIVASPQFLNKRNPDSREMPDSQIRKGD